MLDLWSAKGKAAVVAAILVVDDEPQVSGLLSAMLVRAGYEVETASSPRAAIEICGPPACFDLVIAEVNMPLMDGHELARWIANHCPGSRTVLMSASPTTCEECPFASRCAFLAKPFDRAGVLATVSSELAALPRKCAVAQMLSANYSIALDRFCGLPEAWSFQRPGGDAARQQKQDTYIALLTARSEYQAHLHQHGCPQPRTAFASCRRIENRLRREFLEARALFDAAADSLSRLNRLSEEVEMASEVKLVLEQAKDVHRAAHEVYLIALQRFSDFRKSEIFTAASGPESS